MPGFSDALETGLLQHLFQNLAVPGLGDAGGILGSVVPGSVYISLHTADPSDAGSQTANEIAYTGYARVGVVRSAAGWTVSGNVVTNTSPIAFPQCTGGSATVLYAAVGFAASGAGTIIVPGALTASLIINPGITPQFAASAFAFTLE